ncbi:cytochrome-c peroxidase [Phaeocystidibacter luteus]|uniref:Cytochrome-c peroxidase n=1 Tax=Phaeocystidibacter luteus TaxID=911197 RepID=A0A6N6RE99_9FLAO|nr:cytochrome c peroxidase [Phaeocystidibacter luteus]KAB2808104.1 cytochrome-c peroxidase [Phaeocystidibacter luteus]
MPVRSKKYKLHLKAASAAFLFLVLIASCSHEEPAPEKAYYLRVPDHFPAMEFPEDNAFTIDRWELGRQLFFDPILSRDSSISCGSCHKAEFALSDNVDISPGVEGRIGFRNSPGLFNVGYYPRMMREGGVPTLEMQVLVPIQEHAEMDFNIVDAASRLANSEDYVRKSQRAYQRNPDPFVITRAIATYERTMISGGSRYDKYLQGQTSALSASEKRGMELFFSNRTDCSSCHSGIFFTNNDYENNGLYEAYTDEGRMRLTNDSADLGRFRVATLRNVEVTGPYMHNGSLPSLESVIEHYNSGGENHPNKSALIRPLALSASEKADLIDFLRSLTDHEFIADERFQP